MTRERRSRSGSSGPNQCAADGGSRRSGRWIEAGSCGAIEGANRAKRMKITASTTPIAASGLWRAFPATRRRSEIAAVDMIELNLPYLESQLSVMMNHFKICPVAGDQAGAARARSQRNQDVEMQIAQFAGRKTASGAKFSQNLARLDPVVFRGTQNGMILCQGSQEISLSSLGRAAPQLRQNYRGASDQSGHRLDSQLMTSGAQIVDENRGIEDDDITHSSTLTTHRIPQT